jgi:hypothetical protein
MPLEELTVGEDLTYQEYPVKILDTTKEVFASSGRTDASGRVNSW